MTWVPTLKLSTLLLHNFFEAIIHKSHNIYRRVSKIWQQPAILKYFIEILSRFEFLNTITTEAYCYGAKESRKNVPYPNKHI